MQRRIIHGRPLPTHLSCSCAHEQKAHGAEWVRSVNHRHAEPRFVRQCDQHQHTDEVKVSNVHVLHKLLDVVYVEILWNVTLCMDELP